MATKKEAELMEEETMTVQEHLNEKVPFYAIYDGERYKDDIVVTINGKSWQIQRGENVMIPRFVFNAIMDAERQKRAATMVSKQFEDQFKAESVGK